MVVLAVWCVVVSVCVVVKCVVVCVGTCGGDVVRRVM